MLSEDLNSATTNAAKEVAAAGLRRRARLESQTQRISVTLRLGKSGYGVGISNKDGHCVIHRVLRPQYEPGSGTMQIGDRICSVCSIETPTWDEATTELYKRPDLLYLTVARDPSIMPPKGSL